MITRCLYGASFSSKSTHKMWRMPFKLQIYTILKKITSKLSTFCKVYNLIIPSKQKLIYSEVLLTGSSNKLKKHKFTWNRPLKIQRTGILSLKSVSFRSQSCVISCTVMLRQLTSTKDVLKKIYAISNYAISK